MTSKKEVTFEETSYDPDELVGLKFKLLVNTDYYEKKNGIWIDMSNDEEYLKSKLADSIELEMVGIIKPNEESVGVGSTQGMVWYTHELMETLITRINESEIVKEQQSNDKINIFTGKEFQADTSFNLNSLSPEELYNLQSMSEEEMSSYIKTMSDNISATYEQNLQKLGSVALDNPDFISILNFNIHALSKKNN